ncbi:hypothetical protein [Paenibacillus sp. MMS18-CY102]|uniref:hypothetical protein n=1 Tax=Paenibacillus sp. MMS18-CY102 TaxID=2682849 RepID=UPI001366014E|nr:hypothetical protein [Paenibacillus sp. MMS18-CY102]MWC29119.1 hypothetical protein [Paenibacillus sp. MMS18-CY102]
MSKKTRRKMNRLTQTASTALFLALALSQSNVAVASVTASPVHQPLPLPAAQ